ncbi:MAG: hypothetical protein NXI20_07210 [bacterium]|nr:hypothetical protein [bacterium]
MKNKKLLYFLVPAVLLIWGVVGYRLMNLNSDDDYIEPIRVSAITGDQEQKKEYQLILNYPDPFLKGLKQAPVPSNNDQPKQNQIVTPVVTVQWESIVYTGFIQNSKRGSRIGLLEINGTKHLAELGSQVGNIAVKKIVKDSILLEKQGSQKWFRISDK